MELHLVQNRKENCHHDHIPFIVKRKLNLVFSVCNFLASLGTMQTQLRASLKPLSMILSKGCQGGFLLGPPWHREASSPRTVARLITVEIAERARRAISQMAKPANFLECGNRRCDIIHSIVDTLENNSDQMYTLINLYFLFLSN